MKNLDLSLSCTVMLGVLIKQKTGNTQWCSHVNLTEAETKTHTKPCRGIIYLDQIESAIYVGYQRIDV
jgi:hypothetical protein